MALPTMCSGRSPPSTSRTPSRGTLRSRRGRSCANSGTLVPYAKLSNVVRSIGSLTFNATSRALAINLQRSGGANEAVSATLPDWIEAGTISDWAETANTDALPEAKIPSLPTGKIIGIREYVEDRAAALIQNGDNLVWAYDDAAGTLTGTVSTNLADVTQIVRDVVNPLGPGLTESFVPSLNRLNIGLDIDTIIQVGSNMTKSVLNGVVTLNATAMGGGGISLQDALDGVGSALTEGSKIDIAVGSSPTTYTISTNALNASEVNDRIDTRLPTVTSFEASDENGIVRRIWTSARVGQRANISAQAHIVGVASPIDVADPTTNTDVFAASKQSVAQAIADNMGTGGMADGIVNSLDLSRSGRDLTVTLGRSIGADLTETVQLPADENRFVDSLGVLITGQTLTVTLGRTAPLPDLVDTATIPTGGMGGGTDTNDFVTGGAFTLSGQELSLQLTGTPGFTTVDFPAITLPAGGGGGGGAAGRTLIGTIASSNAQTAAALTLDEALSETTLYRATLTDGDGTVATADFLGAELLGLSETAAPPTSDNNSLLLSLARPGSLTGSAATVVRIWNGDSSTGIYVQKSRTDTQAFRLYRVVYQAAGGGGSDENNYLSGVTSSVAGQMVTLNFAREGLANLSTDFMIPGGGGRRRCVRLGHGRRRQPCSHRQAGDRHRERQPCPDRKSDFWARASEHADGQFLEHRLAGRGRLHAVRGLRQRQTSELHYLRVIPGWHRRGWDSPWRGDAPHRRHRGDNGTGVFLHRRRDNAELCLGRLADRCWHHRRSQPQRDANVPAQDGHDRLDGSPGPEHLRRQVSVRPPGGR